MNWLTNTIFYLSPLALFVLLFAAAVVGWVLYGLRGYKHWFKRFHRYRVLPPRRRMRKTYGYVEYIPEVINRPIMQPPVMQRRPPVQPIMQSVINQQPPLRSTKDDLQVIEGIGPKIEEVLNNNGIYTWHELSHTPTENLMTMLERTGLQNHNPSTWPKQAYMAHTGEWNQLKEYQDSLTPRA